MVKMSQLGNVLSKQVQLKRTTDGAWGWSPQKFGNFFEKQAISMPLDHTSHVLRAIWKN